MRWLKVVLMTLLLLQPLPLFANEGVQVKVTIRDSGYQMGDFLHQRISLKLPNSHRLDMDSLPLQGRVSPWLDLHHLDVNTHGESVALELVWQLFATVETAQILKTPAFQVKTIGPSVIQISIPSVDFHYSPVFGIPLEKVSRKADFAPTAFDEQTPLWMMIIFGTLSLSAGIGWLWLTDRLVWWPCHVGPMTKLARRIKGLPKEALTQQHITDVMHALNQTAGQSLYPNTLQQLYRRAPYLTAFAPQILAFFEFAWASVYGHQPLLPAKLVTMPVASTHALLDWVTQAAMAERLHFRQRQHSTPVNHSMRRSSGD